MAVSGHGSEGQAGSQGRGRFSPRLLSLLVWEGARGVALSAPHTPLPFLPRPQAGAAQLGAGRHLGSRCSHRGLPSGAGEESPRDSASPHSPTRAATPTQLALQEREVEGRWG